MAYTKQTWADGSAGGTPVSAARLNHEENGIQEASDRLGVVEAAGYQTGAQVTSTVTAAVAPKAATSYVDAADTALSGRVSTVETALPGKAATTYVDAADTALSGRVGTVEAALPGKANTSSLAPVATSGSAGDLTGTLPTSALPALAITDVYTVATQSEMTNLSAHRGDVAIRSDLPATFMLAAEPASTLGNWKQLATPADAVLSVQGQTGVVVLVKSDLGLGSVDNTTDLAKPVSTATQTALNTKAPLSTTDALGGRVDALETGKLDKAAPVDLPFSATVNSSGTAGRHFRVTATGDFTLANPTNLQDGDRLVYEIRQDGTGGHHPTLGSLFNAGDATLGWSVTGDTVDYLGVIYRASGPHSPSLDVLAFRPGL